MLRWSPATRTFSAASRGSRGRESAFVTSRVVDGDQTPAYVADQLDLSLSAAYEALSYYYAHVEEMRRYERENEAAFDRLRESSLKPKETVQ
jgi:hypothetical protein